MLDRLDVVLHGDIAALVQQDTTCVNPVEGREPGLEASLSPTQPKAAMVSSLSMKDAPPKVPFSRKLKKSVRLVNQRLHMRTHMRTHMHS